MMPEDEREIVTEWDTDDGPTAPLLDEGSDDVNYTDERYGNEE